MLISPPILLVHSAQREKLGHRAGSWLFPCSWDWEDGWSKQRMDRVSRRMDEVNRRMDGVSRRMDVGSRRMDGVSSRLQ